MTEIILHVVLLLLLGYATYFGFSLTKKLYGGKFTSAIPYLVSSIALMFSIQLIEFVFRFSALHEHFVFMFSIQTLQLFSGILLIYFLYKVYQIGFATSGIFSK